MLDFVYGDPIRFLPCLHIYHVNCIDDWLMRSFTCPSCMEPVDAALLSSYETNWGGFEPCSRSCFQAVDILGAWDMGHYLHNSGVHQRNRSQPLRTHAAMLAVLKDDLCHILSVASSVGGEGWKETGNGRTKTFLPLYSQFSFVENQDCSLTQLSTLIPLQVPVKLLSTVVGNCSGILTC